MFLWYCLPLVWGKRGRVGVNKKGERIILSLKILCINEDAI